MLKSKILAVHINLNFEGGAEQYLYDVLFELQKIGYEIKVYFSEDPVSSELASKFSTKRWPPGFFHIYYKNTKSLIEEFKKSVFSEKPDLIYVSELQNPFVSEFLCRNFPVIRYVNGVRLTCYNGRRILNYSDKICEHKFGTSCFLRTYKERCSPRRPDLNLKTILTGLRLLKTAKLAKALITPSDYISKLLIKHSVPPSLIHKIPYYIDPVMFSPDNSIQKIEPPEILFIGRVVTPKGPHLLLPALKNTNLLWRYRIIGEGPLKEDILKQSKELGFADRVIVQNFIPNKELVDYYRKATLTVFPSIWPEPFGIVGIESLACETPVVGFNGGGVSDWLKDGVCGFLVERKDLNCLKNRIEKLLLDRESRERFGSEGRRIVLNNFTKQHHLSKLIPLIEDIISKSRP
ncbi:MAG: glycosyltransferase family 4 protein [Candidatus Hydrogenedentota bacterium]